ARDLVELQTELIRREWRSVESDLQYLAKQAVLRSYLSGSDSGKQELLEEYVLFCRQKAIYDQIRYIDDTGQERMRVNYNQGNPAPVKEDELQSKANRYYFTQAMRLGRDDVLVSPLDLNVEHDEIERPLKPMIRFA